MPVIANNHKKFSVVQFIALPFQDIDDCVCVPTDWVIIRRKQDQKVVVAYPKDEDRFVTRDRVKREEKYDDDWKFWTAELKYEFDTFEDADFWIATRNDYGPLVQENLSLNDTPSTFTFNKKLRSSKQKSTSKSKEDTPEMIPKPYQIARKPLPRTIIKRPGSDESKSQFETKRGKQSITKAAEPTGAGSQSANEGPGPLVIDIDEDNYAQQDQQSSENNNDNNQNYLDIDTTAAQTNLQDNGNSNFQPQIASIQSLATTSNNREPRANESSSNNVPSTSEYEPESIATELYKKMKGKPSLVAKHTAVEKRMHLENITRKVAILLNIPPNSTNQNRGRDMQQTTRRQNSPQRLTETQRRDPRLRSNATIDVEHLPTGRSVNVFDPSNRIDRSPPAFNARDRMQTTLDQRGAHLPISAHRRPVSDSFRPISIRSTPLPQETIRDTPTLLFPNLPDSIQRALLVTRSNFLSEEEELQGNLAQGVPIVVTSPDIIINSGIPVQANLYQIPRVQTQMVDSNERNQVYFQDTIDRSPSTSNSRVGMDHDGISAYQIPAHVETTNNVNHSQGNLTFVSQQQIKDQFANISAQMGSTLNYMVNMVENLQRSYQTLLENMERFNTLENPANQASTSRNVIAEVREIAATGNANFNGDQDRRNVFANNAPVRNPTSRLTLPPEYDPNDTRWTLKHYEHMPGLKELMPHSNIYVHYGELKYLEDISSDCTTLARRVLLEVFSKKALSVCSSMTEKGHDYTIYPDERPKLDEHGCLVLLNYILEHGVERDWKTDLQPILKGLHDKVKEIRFRFGVMSRC